jgi:hypothetical protein
MRSNEFDECDAPAEIESNDHPKVAASDLESRTLAIEDFCIRSRRANIFHRIPPGAFDQCSPAMQTSLLETKTAGPPHGKRFWIDGAAVDYIAGYWRAGED